MEVPCSLVVWRFLQLELVAGKKLTHSKVGVGLIAGQGGACCCKELGEVGDLPETSGCAWRELPSFVSCVGSWQHCFVTGHKLQSQVVTFVCVSDPGSHPEELVAPGKPESLETPQPAAENQETCGQSRCTSSTSGPQQSSEQSPTLEQIPASEFHKGPLPADKAEHGQLKMKDVSSGGSCDQQEVEKAKTEEGSCLRDVVRKKA